MPLLRELGKEKRAAIGIGLILAAGLVLLSFLIIGGPRFLLAAHDIIQFLNCSGSEIGLLVDGFEGGSDRNHYPITSRVTRGEVSIGNFSPSEKYPGKLIIFSNSGPPTLWPPTTQESPLRWTDESDLVEVALEDTYSIPVYVWILTATFDTDDPLYGVAPLRKAIEAHITTSRIWAAERQGIRFSTFAIIDATQDSDAPAHRSNFECSKTESIKSDIGFVLGAINVYYVNEVYGLPDYGIFCDFPATKTYVIALGIESSDDLLAHEMGHAFVGPDHIDCLSTDPHSYCPNPAPGPFFDTTNVMHGASTERKGLTEGQTFRAVFNEESVINSLYEARPGLITASSFCGNTVDTTTDPNCPPVQKRLWDDEGAIDDSGRPRTWPVDRPSPPGGS